MYRDTHPPSCQPPCLHFPKDTDHPSLDGGFSTCHSWGLTNETSKVPNILMQCFLAMGGMASTGLAKSGSHYYKPPGLLPKSPAWAWDCIPCWKSSDTFYSGSSLDGWFSHNLNRSGPWESRKRSTCSPPHPIVMPVGHFPAIKHAQLGPIWVWGGLRGLGQAHIKPSWGRRRAKTMLPTGACPAGIFMEPMGRAHMGPRWLTHMGSTWGRVRTHIKPIYNPYGLAQLGPIWNTWTEPTWAHVQSTWGPHGTQLTLLAGLGRAGR